MVNRERIIKRLEELDYFVADLGPRNIMMKQRTSTNIVSLARGRDLLSDSAACEVLCRAGVPVELAEAFVASNQAASGRCN